MKSPSQARSLLTAFLVSTFCFLQLVDGTVLGSLPTCEDGCYCLAPPEGVCPATPVIEKDYIETLRTFEHTNPLTIQCNPFQSPACVQGLEAGEACAVNFTAPAGGEECPAGYNYTLETVSMQEAIDDGLYITHTGPCGVCSSLQDLATMLEYNRLMIQGNTCYLSIAGSGFSDVAAGTACFQALGFTENCAETLIQYQRAIDARPCGTNCAALGLDGDQGKPSCSDASGCAACSAGIRQRYQLVAGRTFANSGYPSASAVPCSQISFMVSEQGDICTAATGPVPPTDPPVPAPSSAPVAATSVPAPTSAPVAATLPQMAKCLQTAGLEELVGQTAGAQVSCDCSAAETGATSIPVCYDGDRTVPDNQCGILFEACDILTPCCSNGLRICKNNVCRNAARSTSKTRLSVNFRGTRPETSSTGGFRRQLRKLRGAQGHTRKASTLA